VSSSSSVVRIDFFPNPYPKKEEGLSAPHAESPCESVKLVAGVRFELTTFGL
jgi:hypothetical protein